jgi:hypothetical protein
MIGLGPEVADFLEAARGKHGKPPRGQRPETGRTREKQ